MSEIRALMAAELAKPVNPRVSLMAAALATEYRDAARAILFYGSCLRESQLDGLMLDFYLIVSDYEAAYGKGWYAYANRLLPPNVFPFAHKDADGELVAKYAVLSEADFARLCSTEAGDVSVWARFAQPTRLVWYTDSRARTMIEYAVSEAPVTLFQYTLPMMPTHQDISTLEIWKTGFGLTYSAELRAERAGRSLSVVDADPDRYRLIGEATLDEIKSRMGVGPNGEVPLFVSDVQARKIWSRFRRKGKRLSLARLAKATTTYAGGIDYIAWKINRHAGTEIAVKDWQRKWPIIGAITMLPKLFKSGAIK